MQGRGAGSGVSSLSSDSEAPYPTYPYYLDDLWRFDLVSGTWTEVTPLSAANPAGRRGHTMVLSGSALIVASSAPVALSPANPAQKH